MSASLLESLEVALLSCDVSSISAALDSLSSVDESCVRLCGSAGLSALHLSLMAGDARSVSEVLKHAPELLVKDNMGRLPLHCAAETGLREPLEALVKRMEDFKSGSTSEALQVRDSRGMTPLQLACGSSDAIEILAPYVQLPVVVELGPLVRQVVARGASAKCLIALSEALPLEEAINQQDETNGKTALFLAVERGCIETVQLLLEFGADLGAVDHEGQNVLHWACFLGNDEMARALRAKDKEGVLCSTADSSGRTPLDYSSALALLNSGFDEDEQDYDLLFEFRRDPAEAKERANMISAAGLIRLTQQVSPPTAPEQDSVSSGREYDSDSADEDQEAEPQFEDQGQDIVQCTPIIQVSPLPKLWSQDSIDLDQVLDADIQALEALLGHA